MSIVVRLLAPLRAFGLWSLTVAGTPAAFGQVVEVPATAGQISLAVACAGRSDSDAWSFTLNADIALEGDGDVEIWIPSPRLGPGIGHVGGAIQLVEAE